MTLSLPHLFSKQCTVTILDDKSQQKIPIAKFQFIVFFFALTQNSILVTYLIFRSHTFGNRAKSVQLCMQVMVPVF